MLFLGRWVTHLFPMSLLPAELCPRFRHYVKLLFAKAAQLSTGTPIPDKVSYDNHHFFKRLFPLSNNTEPLRQSPINQR